MLDPDIFTSKEGNIELTRALRSIKYLVSPYDL